MQELHDESDEARAGVAAKQETAAALHEYEAATASLARALMVDDDCGGGNKNTDQPTEVLSRSQSMSADGDILEEPGSEFRRLQELLADEIEDLSNAQMRHTIRWARLDPAPLPPLPTMPTEDESDSNRSQATRGPEVMIEMRREAWSTNEQLVETFEDFERLLSYEMVGPSSEPGGNGTFAHKRLLDEIGAHLPRQQEQHVEQTASSGDNESLNAHRHASVHNVHHRNHALRFKKENTQTFLDRMTRGKTREVRDHDDDWHGSQFHQHHSPKHTSRNSHEAHPKHTEQHSGDAKRKHNDAYPHHHGKEHTKYGYEQDMSKHEHHKHAIKIQARARGMLSRKHTRSANQPILQNHSAPHLHRAVSPVRRHASPSRSRSPVRTKTTANLSTMNDESPSKTDECVQHSAGVEALAVAPAATAANAAAAAAPAPRADRDKKGYRTNPFRSVGKDGNESQIVKAGAKISPPSSRGTRVSPPASKSSKAPENSSCVGSRTRSPRRHATAFKGQNDGMMEGEISDALDTTKFGAPDSVVSAHLMSNAQTIARNTGLQGMARPAHEVRCYIPSVEMMQESLNESQLLRVDGGSDSAEDCLADGHTELIQVLEADRLPENLRFSRAVSYSHMPVGGALEEARDLIRGVADAVDDIEDDAVGLGDRHAEEHVPRADATQAPGADEHRDSVELQRDGNGAKTTAEKTASKFLSAGPRAGPGASNEQVTSAVHERGGGGGLGDKHKRTDLAGAGAGAEGEKVSATFKHASSSRTPITAASRKGRRTAAVATTLQDAQVSTDIKTVTASEQNLAKGSKVSAKKTVKAKKKASAGSRGDKHQSQAIWAPGMHSSASTDTSMPAHTYNNLSATGEAASGGGPEREWDNFLIGAEHRENEWGGLLRACLSLSLKRRVLARWRHSSRSKTMARMADIGRTDNPFDMPLSPI